MFLMKTPAIFVNVGVECWGRMLYYDNTDDAADWIGHLRVFRPLSPIVVHVLLAPQSAD